jgi:hypothetical protein
MFNPYSKNMKVIWNFMGNALSIQIVAKYDTNIVLSSITCVISFEPS